jgi:phosphatidate cytidylyltransferase
MKLTNSTKIRILSAIILILVLMLIFSLGKKAILLSVFILSLIVFDEIIKYFFKHTREDYLYWLYMAIFVFTSFVFYQIKVFHYELWTNIVLIFSIIFQLALVLGMIFKVSWEKDYIFLNPFFWCINLTSIFLSFVILLNDDNSIRNLIFFISISIVTDSMGWIVGKKWGRKKLYPEVSPNKTVEGALGGWGAAMILVAAFLYMNYQDHFFTLKSLLAIVMLPILAILGDLVQSYFKRMVHLKDSSQRIPGHGGFYDRLDSHLFLIPFFVFFIKMISNHP